MECVSKLTLARRGWGAACVAAFAAFAAAGGGLTLEEGFDAPPRDRRPGVWWFFSAEAPEAAITRDLEAMRSVGLSAFTIYDVHGGSASKVKWLGKVKFALKEANRLGLDAFLLVGNAGCGHPDTPHKFALKDIVFTKATAERSPSGELRVDLPKQSGGARTPKNADGSPELYTEVACLAVPAVKDAPIDSIRDVSAYLDPGKDRLTWPSAPEGKWTIVRCAWLPRVHGYMGCFIDHMSRAALDDHWARVVTPVLKNLSPDERRAFKGVLCDSWEAGRTSWTDTFVEEFRKRRGYDPIPWLAVKAGVEAGDTVSRARFHRDFNVTIGELIADNHYAYKQELAHRDGLISIAEAAGPHQALGDVRMMQGRSDMAMGEFWMPSDHRPEDPQRFMLRDAASAAHVYGIKDVLAESFTTIGTYWIESPEVLKPCADRAFCDGLTRVCYHGMTLSPSLTDRPGTIITPGQQYNAQNTWFGMSGAFNLYLSRCSWMLSRGRFAADALVYAGDAINIFASLKDTSDALGPGFDYDFCPTEVMVKARTDNGEIVLPSGMRYKVVVIADKNPAARRMGVRKLPPPQKLPPVAPFIPPEAEETIARLEKAGVPVLRTRAERAAWVAANKPDFRIVSATSPEDIDWVHRILPECDIYFVANRKNEDARVLADFRVAAARVELWNAVTGTRTDAAFDRHGATTRVELELPPYGSVFAVFFRDAAGGRRSAPSKVTVSQRLTGPWQVSFDPKWGGPENPVEFTALSDWTVHVKPSIRHYSGIATYATTVEPDPALSGGGRLHVDLGDVKNIAEVLIDGKLAGTAWTRPFRVEIPRDMIPEGGMSRPFLLEIRVANLWPNRLIADKSLPPRKRFTKTNINPYKADDPLLPSGLLGPVSIIRTPDAR